MSLSRPQLVRLAIALVLLASAAILVVVRRGDGGPRGVYYYDLAADQLRPGPAGDRTAVRAHVYGCGDCGEQDRRVLWLSRRIGDPASPVAAGDAAAGPHSMQVALRPQPGEQPLWISLLDPQASELSAQAATLCTGQTAVECLP